MLASAERTTPRIPIHYSISHLLLCLLTKKKREYFLLLEIQGLINTQNAVVKSGHLSKRGRQNPKYNRYWFTLKGDVMSYYTDPSGLYFPSGNIDLRYGISATLTDPKENGKDATCFSVVTHQRTYFFKADSATSAKDWVKTLQTVIFRTHNDGDSVKISLPLENVIDIEESPVIDFAETLKIRVVDSDETFAIDDVRASCAIDYQILLISDAVFLLFLQFWQRGSPYSAIDGRRHASTKNTCRILIAFAQKRRYSTIARLFSRPQKVSRYGIR